MLHVFCLQKWFITWFLFVLQPPKSIIAQVQMQNRVPIHTISFNCNDTEANQFLYDLAQATEGRYHYFSEKGCPVDEPEAWQVCSKQFSWEVMDQCHCYNIWG